MKCRTLDDLKMEEKEKREIDSNWRRRTMAVHLAKWNHRPCSAKRKAKVSEQRFNDVVVHKCFVAPSTLKPLHTNCSSFLCFSIAASWLRVVISNWIYIFSFHRRMRSTLWHLKIFAIKLLSNKLVSNVLKSTIMLSSEPSTHQLYD